MSWSKGNVLGFLVLFSVSFLVVILYFPGMNGPFLFDDMHVFVENSRMHITDFSFNGIKSLLESSNTGPLGRPIALLSLAFNYYMVGLETFWYKATNSIIHVFNGFLVFLCFMRFLKISGNSHKKSLFISLMVACIWTIHPINLTSVLYVVQRMASLSCTWMLLSIFFYLCARQRQMSGEKPSFILFSLSFLSIVLGAFTKENSILAVGILFWAEALVLKFSAYEKKQRQTIKLLCVALLLGGVSISIWLVFNWGHVFSGYANRDFSLEERVLTQARVVWFYVRLIFIPDIPEMALFHDTFSVSKGFFAPFNTALSLAGWCIVIGFGVACYRKLPYLSFGVAWFLTGHVIESTIIPLEMVYEHRNYFPMIGLIFVAVYYAYDWLEKDRVRFLIPIGISIFLAFSTHLRAREWQSITSIIASELETNPTSPRANYLAGHWFENRYYIEADRNVREELYNKANFYMDRVIAFDENGLSGLFKKIQLESFQYSGKVNDNTLSLFLNRLRSSIFTNQNLYSLNKFSECISKNECRLSIEYYSEIIKSLVENKTLGDQRKSVIISDLGVRVFSQGSINHSEQLFKKSLELYSNNHSAKLSLVAVFMLNRQLEDARRLLLDIPESELDQKGVLTSQSYKKSLGI